MCIFVLDIFVMGEIFDVCICILNIVWWGFGFGGCVFEQFGIFQIWYIIMLGRFKEGLKKSGNFSYRVVFLTGPPNFQYQNEKRLAANQRFCSMKFSMYKRSSLVE